MKSPEERVASIKAKLAEAQRLEQMRQDSTMQNTPLNHMEKAEGRKSTSTWWKLGIGGVVTAVAAALIIMVAPKVSAPMDTATTESSKYTEQMEVGNVPSGQEVGETDEGNEVDEAEDYYADEAEVDATTEEADMEAEEIPETTSSMVPRQLDGYDLIESSKDDLLLEGQNIGVRRELWRAEDDSSKEISFTVAKDALSEEPYLEEDDEEVTINLAGQDLTLHSRDNQFNWVFTQGNAYYYGQSMNLSLTELEEFLSDYLDLAD